MTSARDDDRALVERLRRHGDRDAFGALYERHTARLYRLALRLCAGDRFAAEDVVHDAWVAAVPKLASFEWRSALSSWLAGFVVNFARVRRRPDADVPLEDTDAVVEDRALTGTVARVDLERALAALPHGYREVLVLHDIEGLSHEDIGALLGITAGGSKSQLSRARAAMRRQLAPPGGEGA